MWLMSNLCEAHARACKHSHKHPSLYWWWRCLLTGGACLRKYKLTQRKQAPAGLALQHGASGALMQELALFAPCSIRLEGCWWRGTGVLVSGGSKDRGLCVRAVHLRSDIAVGQAADTGRTMELLDGFNISIQNSAFPRRWSSDFYPLRTS